MSKDKKTLPDGWVETCLGNICTKPQYGWTTKAAKKGGTLRLLRTTDISSGRVDWSQVPYCQKHPKDPSQYFLQTGDIVVSRAGSVGKSFLIREDVIDAVFASYLVRFKPLIESEYINYFMQSQMYWNQIQEQSAGIAVPNVNASKLGNLTIPVAPLNEQKRIVDKIALLFSDLDEGENLLRTVQKQLGIYRQTVLKAAVTGELTKTWRDNNKCSVESGAQLLERLLKAQRDRWKGSGKYKEPVSPDIRELKCLPEGWVWVRMEQISEVMGGLTKNQKRKTLPLKRPMLRVANVYQNRFELDDIHEIGVTEVELQRVSLQKDDILIVEGNGSKDQIGRMAIWNDQVPNCIHQNHLIKARLSEKRLAKYVMNWFMSRSGREIIETVASSTSGLYTLSISKIDELVVPLPSMDESEEIVNQIEDVFSQIDALENWCMNELKRSGALRQSILKDAFSGKLVSQNKADEPASMLLHRILAEKATRQTPKAKQNGRSSKSEAA